jgi:hypothetical protein
VGLLGILGKASLDTALVASVEDALERKKRMLQGVAGEFIQKGATQAEPHGRAYLLSGQVGPGDALVVGVQHNRHTGLPDEAKGMSHGPTLR